MVSQGLINEDIDLRVEGEITGLQLVEELEEIHVDKKEPIRVLKIGLTLSPALKEELGKFLKKNLDVFAWTHDDIEGINPMKHQKCRPMNPERYEALKEEVDKLIKNEFI